MEEGEETLEAEGLGSAEGPAEIGRWGTDPENLGGETKSRLDDRELCTDEPLGD
jgi:hypothetical protein